MWSLSQSHTHFLANAFHKIHYMKQQLKVLWQDLIFLINKTRRILQSVNFHQELTWYVSFVIDILLFNRLEKLNPWQSWKALWQGTLSHRISFRIISKPSSTEEWAHGIPQNETKKIPKIFDPKIRTCCELTGAESNIWLEWMHASGLILNRLLETDFAPRGIWIFESHLSRNLHADNPKLNCDENYDVNNLYSEVLRYSGGHLVWHRLDEMFRPFESFVSQLHNSSKVVFILMFDV